ncbi:hypothetical protein C8J57DRAFT_1570801 [Mycena rebaudengoi]|nr:hypothetical protein C8J57DRAFT_1570801 [Mycena rebaudengoi]
MPPSKILAGVKKGTRLLFNGILLNRRPAAAASRQNSASSNRASSGSDADDVDEADDGDDPDNEDDGDNEEAHNDPEDEYQPMQSKPTPKHRGRVTKRGRGTKRGHNPTPTSSSGDESPVRTTGAQSASKGRKRARVATPPAEDAPLPPPQPRALPPKSVTTCKHPKNPRPNGRGGTDYVIVMDMDDVRAAANLLRHGFARTIAREGKCATGHHKESTVSFLHDDGSLELAVEDYVFMRNLKGEGKTEHDVCVSFAFHICSFDLSEELGGDYLYYFAALV